MKNPELEELKSNLHLSLALFFVIISTYPFVLLTVPCAFPKVESVKLIRNYSDKSTITIRRLFSTI